MDNYKIINTHTNEIIKALNDLGYVWTPKKFDEQDCLVKAHWILAKETGEIAYSSGTHIDSPLVFKELTLPQLRDLVVLHRNDVKDANVSDGTHYNLYQTSDNRLFFYAESANEWVISDLSGNAETLAKLKPITQDPALISGAEALRYIACGRLVQWISKDFPNWTDLDITNINAKNFIDEERIKESGFKYRLKPTTLTVNAELPKPNKETQHNSLVYAVTYEFKTREERNAFADKLRGTNS
ncbi:hypothetical protein ACF0AK_08490 [Acinetobacter baumannii]|uniref:hypothetical protein n=1 Tax=Acinetobacter baumannii TaxID=470 RepID=UPI001D197EF4|nr:hypothetical protein [Acinetobacter baumannii]